MENVDLEKKDKKEVENEKMNFKAALKRLGLHDEKLIEMYATMCKIRRFERMADRLYAAGKVHGICA